LLLSNGDAEFHADVVVRIDDVAFCLTRRWQKQTWKRQNRHKKKSSKNVYKREEQKSRTEFG